MIEPVRSAGDASHHMIKQKAISRGGGSSCKQQVFDELDDPNELWRRPHSMWVILIAVPVYWMQAICVADNCYTQLHALLR